MILCNHAIERLRERAIDQTKFYNKLKSKDFIIVVKQISENYLCAMSIQGVNIFFVLDNSKKKVVTVMPRDYQESGSMIRVINSSKLGRKADKLMSPNAYRYFKRLSDKRSKKKSYREQMHEV